MLFWLVIARAWALRDVDTRSFCGDIVVWDFVGARSPFDNSMYAVCSFLGPAG